MTASLDGSFGPPAAAVAAPASAPRPAGGVTRPKAPESKRADLRVVETGELSPRARRRRLRWLAAGTAVMVCAGLFGVVAFHVVLAQGQFRLDHVDNQVAAQQAQYDRLRLQVATLESPARIVAAAQERLGMVPPPSVRYLSPTATVAGKGTSTTATTAPGAGHGSPAAKPTPATSTAASPSKSAAGAPSTTVAAKPGTTPSTPTTAVIKSGPATTTAPKPASPTTTAARTTT